MRILFLVFIILNLFCSAQVKLNSFIGSDKRPADTDTVQQSLHVKYTGDEPGYKRNSTVNNFKLFGLKNDSLELGTELAKGKPVFLINGSFSCPFFRRSLHFFDSIAANNKNISCFIIYTIEAHPDYPFICPYTDEVTVLKMNHNDDVNIKQHKTYADRKKAASDMIARIGTKIPVFLDTPSNTWIHTFGEMPDLAYLINTKGEVKYKYLDYRDQRKEICRDLNLINKK